MTDEIFKNNLKTTTQASSLLCPYVESRTHCATAQCMAWIEVYHERKREDHSGGHEMMLSLASDRRQTLRREGPGGCMGLWVLDAKGYCAKALATVGGGK